MGNVGLQQTASTVCIVFWTHAELPQINDNEPIRHLQALWRATAECSSRMQNSFKSVALSNTDNYLLDAVVYALDPDAMKRKDLFTFNRQRLQCV